MLIAKIKVLKSFDKQMSDNVMLLFQKQKKEEERKRQTKEVCETEGNTVFCVFYATQKSPSKKSTGYSSCQRRQNQGRAIRNILKVLKTELSKKHKHTSP